MAKKLGVAGPRSQAANSSVGRGRMALFVLGSLVLMSGCAPTSVPVQGSVDAEVKRVPPDAVYGAAASAIPALIMAEREGSITKDLALLSTLWLENAQIIDGRNTEDPADDYRCQGKAAILDRYLLAVFPSPPPPLDAEPRPEISVDGEEAIAVNGVDRWRFKRLDGQWLIAELAYLRP